MGELEGSTVSIHGTELKTKHDVKRKKVDRTRLVSDDREASFFSKLNLKGAVLEFSLICTRLYFSHTRST